MLSAVDRAIELRPGLWQWLAHHPTWKQDVASYLVAADGDVVLIDPLAPPGDAAPAFWSALDRASASRKRLTVLVTVPDHARSTAAIAGRYPDAVVYTAARRRRRSLEGVDALPLEPAAELPAGIRAFDTSRADERAIWIALHRALVVGDVLLGTPDGGLEVCPEGWLPRRATRSTVAAALDALPLLDIDLVLPTHGDAPADSRAALSAAIAEARS